MGADFPIHRVRSGNPAVISGITYIKRGEKWLFPPKEVRAKTRNRVRKALSLARTRLPTQPKFRGRLHIRLSDNGRTRVAALQLPTHLVTEPTEVPGDPPVVRALPRRIQAHADTVGEFTRPQMTLEAAPRVGAFDLVRRLLVWLGALRFFLLGNLWDRLRKRDSEARRAVRLRQAFERAGGTLVKIGQQMASRLDLLPLRYCEELLAMLDRYPPFPTEQALAIVERTTGQPLERIFSVFDPEPIGSASIACVYQAVLRETGERVAVKVRRPGIRRLFETDFRVLDILGELAEFLTLIRPGVSRKIRDEFRDALTSELDFTREARVQEVFRREANQDRLRFFSAPCIIPEYSNREVIVQEFVSGMWLYEVLAGIEQRDPVALKRMEELNVDPRLLARRLLFMANWGIFRSLAFHADPHPANIVVRANSELVFIDFGATGYFNSARRKIYARMYESYSTGNIWEMAKMGLAIAEPLPAVDINQVTRDIERTFYEMVLAVKSKNSPWYERTTASVWISNLKVMTKHNVNTPQDLLMFVRSSLLYDTLGARLHPQINFYKEANRYFRWARRRRNRRGRQALRRLQRKGLLGSLDFQHIGRLAGTFNDLVFRLQRLFSAPYDFAVLPFIVEKWVSVLTNVIRFLTRTAFVTGLGIALDAGLRGLAGQPLDMAGSFSRVIMHPAYLGVVALLALIHTRLVLFRVGEKTVER